MRLDLANVYRVSNRPAGVSSADVRHAETQLGFRFPPGYADAITALGTGEFSVTLRIFDPQRCVDETTQARDLHRALYPLPAPAYAQSFVRFCESAWYIAHRSNAAGIWFSPSQGACFEVDDDLVLTKLPADFLEAIGELLAREIDPPYRFEPFEGRQRWRFSGEPKGLDRDDEFDEAVTRFRGVGPRGFEVVSGARGEANRGTHLFFREFGGSVDVFAGDGGVSLSLTQDRGAEHPSLDAAFRVASDLGYSRQPHPLDP